MKRYCLFILVLFITATARAQVNVDSLRRVINSKQPYQEKITASIKILENFETKNFDTTIIEGNKALALARKNTDSIAVAKIKRHIGVASYFQGKYDIAAKNYYESVAILEKANEKKELAPLYNELGKLYRKTRDLDKAMQNYEKAAALFKQLNDSAGVSMILNESGVVYEYKADYKEALNRYTASLNLAEARGDSLSVSYAVSNIAGIFVIEKKYTEAEKNLLRALNIRQLLKDSFAIALTYSDLGVAMNGKGDYIKATSYLQMSNKLAETLQYVELQSNNYSELASVAQRKGQYQEAYEYYLKRSYLRDSLYAMEKTKQIAELNTKYESAKKEQQIKEQHNRIRMQNFLFIGIGGLALLTGLLINSQYRRNKLRQEAQMKTELMKQQEMAVKAVIEAEENERQRIAKDLHDGVGQMMSAAKMNLSAFESEVQFANDEQKKSLKKVIQLVDESCKEVRTVSHIMMPNALLKNNLAAAIHDFVNKLNNKTLQAHVNTIGLDERMDSNIETVLYRVMQECVHNAIKHAGATTLDISLIRDKDGISGTVEDNGKGFDAADKDNFEGIGLKNITTRIEYLKGTVDFDTAPGRGTVVAFHVPFS
ncbi:MAG: tetratricopeptide repeat protein [Chitinophagaceae bacterium]|nr:tetratricopeptide repeat protein [Chitinophagaceae bacterium]MBK9465755.1 tetratricopeptide repeat protein [Chitinophagaceae bacterium]MBK9939308.1 tetratricopeptide repeat protein [Chitinophagaceae bacterium]MBP6233838.1 tetratricopeptide repeat protein [Chitinophagaceae bacterium]HQW43618.1 sensor histidine kinase [Chitinophagaceae bacterium]